MATSSLPSLFSIKSRGSSYLKGCNIPRTRRLQVLNVHNYQDEGRSTNMVDANLNALKERIEMAKVKERLERCCKCQHGWNYHHLVSNNNQHKIKKSNKELNSLIELTCLVCGTLGFTCFGGTLFLCLVSLLVHLQL